MAKRALVSGATGQDGSYLLELLLQKGYEVYGLVRRLSTPNIANISHIKDRVTLLDGDLIDQSSLNAAVKESSPDEVYNLAAQSFVGTSFVQPVLTGEITGLGALRLLEAVRAFAPQARVYQASSSEMFGKVSEEPQSETTAFHPRSPYGVAKVYAYWASVNYREAHNMFVSNGILFNHESCASDTPLIVRTRSGFLDCAPMSDLVPHPSTGRQRTLDFDVWDRGGFTRALLSTAYPNSAPVDKRVKRVVARSGEVRVTEEHVLLIDGGDDRTAGEIVAGERLVRTELPDPPGRARVTPEAAKLLGLMVAEGSVYDASGRLEAAFRGHDSSLLDEVQTFWETCADGTVSDAPSVPGITAEAAGGLRLQADRGTLRFLHESLYTSEGHKRVPRLILNADRAAWRAFLSGYRQGEGSRTRRAGWDSRTFKASSPVLVAGVWWMASRVLDPTLSLGVDFLERGGFGEPLCASYSITMGGEGGNKGSRFLRPRGEVTHVLPESYTGWLYDIATESGTFHAGVGDLVIHNSPRRGFEFVTRTISQGVAKIHLGIDKQLRLGNLEAKRDWGYAREFVDLMWRALQHAEPDDFVGATGESHSVREFVEEAFKIVGIADWERYVVTDERRFRPAEVFNLRGDASKATRLLGWEAKTRFKDLVNIMVEADVKLLEGSTRHA